jgi:hypothetical protein
VPRIMTWAEAAAFFAELQREAYGPKKEPPKAA